MFKEKSGIYLEWESLFLNKLAEALLRPKKKEIKNQ